MTAIRITDSTNVELITANPHLSGGLGKYLPKGLVTQLVAGTDLVTQVGRDVLEVDKGERGLNLTFANDFPLTSPGVVLKVGAGLSARIGVFNRTGMVLFDQTIIGPTVKVPAGQVYVSFAIAPTMAVGASAPVGPLSFGFDAGAQCDVRCYRPFDITGSPVTFGEACKAVLESFTIPADVQDLRHLATEPDGTIACVSGHGHLEVGGSANIAAAFNPLASTAPIPMIGKVELTGAGSVTVGFKARVTGEFQVRAQHVKGQVVRLSYHKMASSRLEVSLEASAGLGLEVMDKDLLKMFFNGDSSIDNVSDQALAASGITSAQLAAIKKAMKAGMSRKLTVDLAAQFAKLEQQDAAFLYEIDLAKLDAAGAKAVDKALTGDLSGLNQLEEEKPGHGIKVLQSRLIALRETTVRWRVNLLGLVNVLHMSKLVKSASVFHDEESGELTIADETTTERFGAVTQRDQVRKLLYEHAVLTVTYKAAGLDVNADLAASQSFLFFDKRANRHRMSDFLDAVAAVGLMDRTDIDEHLGGIDDFGKASLLLEAQFGQQACEDLFLDAGGPRPSTFYQGIGRAALLALVQPNEPDAYRRLPLLDNALWLRMVEDRNTLFGILPPPITGGADERVRVGTVRTDLITILWWAETMATAATKLTRMREVLGKQTAATLEKAPAFVKVRKELQEAMASALRKNTSLFDDPWGLVALSNISRQSATVTASIASDPLQLSLP